MIDPKLSDVEDWELLLALHHHAEPWDGLVTTDTRMLRQGPELAVLLQTKLTLVSTRASGNNPVKASGLLFAYLAGICSRTDPTRTQVWDLNAVQRPATDPWDLLEGVARHQHRDAAALYEERRLSEAQLAVDPLADGG